MNNVNEMSKDTIIRLTGNPMKIMITPTAEISTDEIFEKDFIDAETYIFQALQANKSARQSSKLSSEEKRKLDRYIKNAEEMLKQFPREERTTELYYVFSVMDQRKSNEKNGEYLFPKMVVIPHGQKTISNRRKMQKEKELKDIEKALSRVSGDPEEFKKLLKYCTIVGRKYSVDERVIKKFEEIATKNGHYVLSKLPEDVPKEEKNRALIDEIYTVIKENAEYIDFSKLLMDIAYNYYADIIIGIESLDVEKDAVNVNMKRKLIDSILEMINPNNTMESYDLTKAMIIKDEDKEKLKKYGINPESDDVNLKKLKEIDEAIYAELVKKSKQLLLVNPYIKVSQIDKLILERIEFSEKEIYIVFQSFEEDEFLNLFANCKSIKDYVENLKKGSKKLDETDLKILKSTKMINDSDIIEFYLKGKIEIDSFDLNDLISKNEPDNIISYKELTQMYNQYKSSENEYEKEGKREQLIRGIKLYRHINEQNKEKQEDDELEYALDICNEDGRESQGVSDEDIIDMYDIDLIGLESLINVKPSLISDIYEMEMSEGKEISAELLLNLINSGKVTPKDIDIKEYILNGSIPLHEINDIDALDIYRDEGVFLLNNDSLNSKGIFELYYRGIITSRDLINKLESIQSEEEKIEFIYGNFSDDRYKDIFDLLIQRLDVGEQMYTRGHNNGTEGERKPKVDPDEEKIRRSGMPSKSRWILNKKLDEDLCFMGLDEGYVLFYYPTSGKVEIEKMLDRYKGEIVDAYGKATFLMDKGTFNKYRNQILTFKTVNSKVLQSLAKQGLAERITHFPEMWGNKKFEYICGGLPDAHQRRKEVEPILNEIKKEMKKAREEEKNNA